MFKKFFFSIAAIGFILAASIISPLNDVKKENFLHRDFVNGNFINDDQSTPNLYPLSFQSPNILTNIEGVPTREVQLQERFESFESLMYPYYSDAPPELPTIVLVIDVSPHDGSRESGSYIVKTVREFNRENMTNGGYLYKDDERVR